MSEKKSPLPSVIVGSIVILVLLFVSFFGVGILIKQINPKSTKKLLHKHSCKVAYKSVDAKGSVSKDNAWAQKFMTSAQAAYDACMTAKDSVKKADAKKADTKKVDTKKVDTKKADTKKNAVKKATKKTVAKKMTPKQKKAKCLGVKKKTFFAQCVRTAK